MTKIEEGWWAYDHLCVGDLIVSLNDKMGFADVRTLIDLEVLLHWRPLRIYLLRPAGHKPPAFLFPPREGAGGAGAKNAGGSLLEREVRQEGKLNSGQIFSRKTFSLDWESEDGKRVDAAAVREEFVKRRFALDKMSAGYDFDPYGKDRHVSTEARLQLRRELAEVSATFEKRMAMTSAMDAFSGSKKAVHEVFCNIFGERADRVEEKSEKSCLFRVEAFGAVGRGSFCNVCFVGGTIGISSALASSTIALVCFRSHDTYFCVDS